MKQKVIIKGLAVILLALIIVTGFSPIKAVAGIEITDMVGREVTIPGQVERVVTTYTPATQFIMALGAQDRLVAGSSGLPNQPIFKMIHPQIEQLPRVGSKNKGVNLEAIIEVDPDLVIMFPHGDGLETADRLQELGIPALVIKPESFRQIRAANRLLGQALGLEEKAEQIDREYQRILELVEPVRQLPRSRRKRVYFANSQLLDTVGAGILQTDLIELAGGINPAKEVKEGFIEASPEQLIEWNPGVIIVSQFYREELDNLKQKPGYQSVAAFANNKIYRIPSNLEPWDYPSPSSALIVVWLAHRLYPEEFAELDISEVVDQFYKILYGKTYSEFGGVLE